MDRSPTGSSRLTLEIVRDIIAKDEMDVEIESLEEEPGSGRGDNYTSMLYRIRAKGHKKLTGIDWERAIIYKVLPLSRVRREAFKSEILFRNEVAFYTHVWPALNELQCGMKKVFGGVAKIYLARSDLIAMEDLKERGYVMADRTKGLQVHHLKLVLEALAGFHALSLTLRDSRSSRKKVGKTFFLTPGPFTSLYGDVQSPRVGPDLFAHLSDEKSHESVREALFRVENEDWYRQYYRVAAGNAIAMVSEALPSKVEHRRDEIMQKLHDFLHEDVFFRTMCELASTKGELTVFCHGDCWTNNILFAEQTSSNVEPVCLVDFQLTRVGSLALDLSNLLYCCTSGEIREAHMTELLGHYHSHLMDALKALNPEQRSAKDSSLMWKLLNDEMRRCGRFGAGLALDILPISTCASDEAPDVYEGVVVDTIGEKARNPRAPPPGGAACARLMTDLVLELIQNRAL